MIENLPATRIQRNQAWAVHVFTTLGIVVAMFALRDVLNNRPGHAIIWLVVTIVIDGVDGPVARALVVKERVPRIDGYVLDLIIDYVTCVIVPAAFMYQFKLLPDGFPGAVLLGLLVFTAAIWFSRVDMMDDDNWFRGFPAAWNLVVPVLFLMHARPWVGGVVTLLLSIASLTNLRVPHVMRARYLRFVTLPLTVVWVSAITIGASIEPHRPWVLRPIMMVGSFYFVFLSLWQTWRTHRMGSRAPAEQPVPELDSPGARGLSDR